MDFNWVEIPEARFELNFARLFNFGEFGAASLICPNVPVAQQAGCIGALGSAPNLTPVQTYGLGFPSIFIGGFGDPISKINNKPMAFFAQDSWKMLKNFTLNYGVRYDFELTSRIPPVAFRDPLSGINLSATDILAAQDAVGVQQGFPRDKNNWAPRLGFAWDIFGNQKTKLSGSIGFYYDHPLLAVAFNSDIADAAQQQQSVLTPGSPRPRHVVQCRSSISRNSLRSGWFSSHNLRSGGNSGRGDFCPISFSGNNALTTKPLPVSAQFCHSRCQLPKIFNMLRQLKQI